MEKRPNRIKDVSGLRFGSLTVLEMNGRVLTPCGSVKTTYKCLCDCGNIKTTKRSNLVNGYTKSCGCLAKKILFKRNFKHGMVNTPEYRTWRNMLDRCINEKNRHYKSYGGRGIIVCERWSKSFENFYKDMGERPKGNSIDRINPDGNYEPENCRWATKLTQARNKRKSRIIEYKGQTKPLKEWANILGINYFTLHSRLHKLNKTIEEAFKL